MLLHLMPERFTLKIDFISAFLSFHCYRSLVAVKCPFSLAIEIERLIEPSLALGTLYFDLFKIFEYTILHEFY